MSMWVVVEGIGVLGELYFFFMQRSALQVCRARDLPQDARFALLPGYYRAGRVPTLLKWVAAIVLIAQGSWLLGAGIVLAGWVLSVILPIPHKVFFNIFYRELDNATNRAPPEVRKTVRAALKSVDRKYGVTGRFGGDGRWIG